eukprot:TRINITY_DN91888_c0_g1_i1.p1 TRINITY_DN91888_c0_g1~~TRINITY_DN91888_c0_g1_i1.p1  ORF type:complete len:1473 (+),score=347.71 TRINITY_DN91888_c0_g1_i1:45-4421(+)
MEGPNRPSPPEGGRPTDMTARPRPRRRVVIQRKVSAAAYEKHKEQMESLGLDPSDPVPAEASNFIGEGGEEGFDTMDPEMPMLSPSNTSDVNAGEPMAVGTSRPTVKALKAKKMVSLKTRTLEEQIVAGRYDRALDRFSQQQKEWEKFRHIAAAKTGRPKDELVVTRAEEYRERLEVMELVDRATPEEIKSGGHNWYHSLRGEGERFIQVGNMFSGLYLPMKMHKENYVHEIVRKPLLQELTSTRREAEATGKKKPRTWRDDEYLMARIRRYGIKMRELAPGHLDYHETLEPEVKALRPENPDGPMAEEGQALKDEEAYAMLVGDQGHEGASVPDELGEEPPAASVEILQEGPHAEASPSKLHFNADVKKMSSQSVRLKNTGTAVISFEWVQNLPQHGFQESILPDDATCQFTCHDTKGRVLPGCEVQTLFSFTSMISGNFTSSWRLHTYPELKEPIYELAMNGTAKLGDLHWERRDALQTKLMKTQTLSLASELAEDIVASVRLQPPPLPDLSLELVQERLFEEVNAAQGLFWTPQTWEHYVALRDKVDSMMPPSSLEESSRVQQAADPSTVIPAGARGRKPVPKVNPPSAAAPLPSLESLGVPSVSRMEAQLAKLPGTEPGAEKPAEKVEVIRQLDRASRTARKRPLERSEVWWLAYETVMEIVSVLPGKWAASRERAGLQPLPFLPPPDEGASAEEVAEYEAKKEERNAKKGEEEKEAEVRGIFSRGFMKNKFGPAVGRFSATAKEATLAARIRKAGGISLGDRLRPYLGRQSTETAELSSIVVLYQCDLGFMTPPPPTPAPSDAENQEPSAPQLVLAGDVLEQVKLRLQGVVTVLESGPLALLIVAHLGEPSPDQPVEVPEGEGDLEEDSATKNQKFLKAVLARMASLPSMEPLLEVVRELVGTNATSVEFVPHEVWMGDADAFARKVRNDEIENKVYLLENLSAIPEESGVRRAVHPEPVKESSTPDPNQVAPEPSTVPDVFPITWASREGWAARAFRDIQPECLVQDALPLCCKAMTLSTGLWPRAPYRIMGPFIEAELGGFLETLALPFRASPEEEAAAIAEKEQQAADEEDGQAKVIGGFLVMLGGGGFGAEAAGGAREGEEALMKKLELLIGLSRLVDSEKGEVHVALSGELATCVLSGVLGIPMGRTGSVAPEGAIGAALREALLEVMRLGVGLSVPVDLVCEVGEEEEWPPLPDPTKEQVGPPKNPNGPVVSLRVALREASQRPPVFLGFFEGRERYLCLDPETGSLDLHTCEPGEAPPAAAWFSEMARRGLVLEGVEPEKIEEVVEAEAVAGTWTVRDIGDATNECTRIRLRRSRGALWNGSLGCCEDTRWQSGTRNFLALVDGRLTGAGEEDDDDDEEDEEEEEEDEEGDEDGERPKKEPKAPKEKRADFEVALVIGRDSKRMLPTLTEQPGNVSFVSNTGEGLLQILRGVPLPGMLACLKTGRS